MRAVDIGQFSFSIKFGLIQWCLIFFFNNQIGHQNEFLAFSLALSFYIGVYADDVDVKKFLSEKYGELSALELKGNEELKNDLMECDVSMTIRLQIVYGRLSIRSVRSAFEESVGSRLQKFGGSDTKELLQRWRTVFTQLFHLWTFMITDWSFTSNSIRWKSSHLMCFDSLNPSCSNDQKMEAIVFGQSRFSPSTKLF